MSQAAYRTFDELEAMHRETSRLTEAANRHLAIAQMLIDYDSYWVRFYQPTEGKPLVIFGHVFTAEQAAEDEDEVVIETLKRQHERGFMYSEAFSVVAPGGELGSTHRASLWPISVRLFADAQKVIWRHQTLPVNTAAELADVYTNWGKHSRAVTERMRRQ